MHVVPAAGAPFVRGQNSAVDAAPAAAAWWKGLHDPQLDALVHDALLYSPTIDEAEARIREAEAQLRQQRVSQLPSVSANATYLRADLPGVGIGTQGSDQGSGDGAGSSSLNYYNLGLNASWELDLFGGGRRGVEQVAATISARRADLADAHVTLSAQVAQSYVDLRDVQERLRLNETALAVQRRQIGLVERRAAAGTASSLDVTRLRGDLQATQADAVPLSAQREVLLDQLALLTGHSPGALDALLNGAAPVPLPPQRVAVGDPAQLIARRPDVRMAERELAAATAAIGVSKAKELPKISFRGIFGLGGTSLGDVLDPSSLTSLLTPSLSWSFLDFGRNRAATHVSEARRDQADARYRQAVLKALQEAEAALSRFGNARQQLGELLQAETIAAKAERLNSLRVSAGTSTLVDQLDVQRQHLARSMAVAQARAALTSSFITVNKTLGLGWETGATADRTGSGA